MKKLSLKLHELAVESFQTGAAGSLRGTVHGRCDTGESCYEGSGEYTCQITCYATCAATCGERTCNGEETCEFTCAHPLSCYGLISC